MLFLARPGLKWCNIDRLANLHSKGDSIVIRLVQYTIMAAVVFSFAASPVCGQVSVVTWHNDNARTGQNLAETILTPSTVNSTNFGKKCSYSVDGQVYAQLLYVPGVSIAGGTHNVVYAATEHDSVYAFDAVCLSTSPLWHTTFLGSGITTMPCTNKTQPQCDTTVLAPEHGITSTPVIDTARNTIYVEAQTVENGVYT